MKKLILLGLMTILCMSGVFGDYVVNSDYSVPVEITSVQYVPVTSMSVSRMSIVFPNTYQSALSYLLQIDFKNIDGGVIGNKIVVLDPFTVTEMCVAHNFDLPTVLTKVNQIMTTFFTTNYAGYSFVLLRISMILPDNTTPSYLVDVVLTNTETGISEKKLINLDQYTVADLCINAEFDIESVVVKSQEMLQDNLLTIIQSQ
jgi:hypothetical protein